MRQASWNLCPQDIQYNTACYADPDVTFSSIAGSSSTPMPDLPDGDWDLVLKKDIFQKVSLAGDQLWGATDSSTTAAALMAAAEEVRQQPGSDRYHHHQPGGSSITTVQWLRGLLCVCKSATCSLGGRVWAHAI